MAIHQVFAQQTPAMTAVSILHMVFGDFVLLQCLLQETAGLLGIVLIPVAAQTDVDRCTVVKG